MKTVFVSRHAGAVSWAAQNGFKDVEIMTHLVGVGGPVRIIGTLPVNLAAEVCEAGGEYWHLTLNVPPEARGRELTAEEMTKFGARVERMHVYTDRGLARVLMGEELGDRTGIVAEAMMAEGR